MIRDLRHFLRSLRKDWLHWSLAIVILGTAIGATASVYALYRSFVLRPLPTSDQDRIVEFVAPVGSLPVSDPVDWWKQAHSLQYLAIYSAGQAALRVSGSRGWANTDVVSSDFFRAFGVQMFRGRDFSAEDELPSQNRVVILSYAFWKSNFGGQDATLGTVLALNGVPYTIVGIAPQGFDYTIGTDMWVPTSTDEASSIKLIKRSESATPITDVGFGFVGRLRKGATVSQTTAELRDLLRRLQSYSTRTHISYGDYISAHTLNRDFVRVYGPALKALFAGSLLILVIATANCGAFFVGRAAHRRKEVAVRLVYGATPGRISQQTLIEASGFGLLSGAIGAITASAILVVSRASFPHYLLHIYDRSVIGPEVFAGCVCLGAVVGTISGLLPARVLASEDIVRTLKNEAGPLIGMRGKWLRHAFVAVQVGVTFVLAIAATLALGTARNMQKENLGYQTKDAFAVHLSLPEEVMTTSQSANKSNPRVRRSSEPPRREGLKQSEQDRQLQSTVSSERNILMAVSAVDGVSATAFTDLLPIVAPPQGVYIRDWTTFPSSATVSTDYFAALNIKFIFGHTFSDAGSPEIVIDKKLSSALWPGENPVGRNLLVMGEHGPRLIVGVVNNTEPLEVGEAQNPWGQIYFPFYAPAEARPVVSLYLLIRCGTRCGDVYPSMIAALKTAGAYSYVDRAGSLASYASALTEPVRARSDLLSIYSGFGLILALTGVFVFASHVSALREREMGIRMALGASRTDLVLQISQESVVCALAGLIVGGVAWVSAGQLLRSLLFGVTYLNAGSFSVVALVLFVVTALASLFPVVAAVTRQNPSDLLRVS